MSGSYTELDLDNLDSNAKPATKEDDSGFEIVEEPEEQEAEVEQEKPVEKPAAKVEEEDDEGGGEASGKRLSRSQRLKAQRDAYAERLREAEGKLAAAEAERDRLAKQNSDATDAGYDFYVQTLTNSMEGLRAEWDQAFANGDQAKLFDVQRRMAELAAEKRQAERDRGARPTKEAGGKEAQQQTQQTTGQTQGQTSRQPSTGGKPNPLAVAWAKEHEGWFNKNAVMTMAARVIDANMAEEGFDPNSEEYFDELTRRMKEEFPHKFQGAAKPSGQARTLNERQGSLPSGNKVRVVITAADKEMARTLGIPLEEYAKQKARREAAQNSATGYTEIV